MRAITVRRSLLITACGAAAILVYYLAGAGSLLVPETELRAAGDAGAGAGTQKDRIAVVEPTFTYAAYQNGSFYNFYHLYRTAPRAENITADLDLLIDSPVPGGPFIHYKAPEKGPTTPISNCTGRWSSMSGLSRLTPTLQNLATSTSTTERYSTRTAPTPLTS